MVLAGSGEAEEMIALQLALEESMPTVEVRWRDSGEQACALRLQVGDDAVRDLELRIQEALGVPVERQALSRLPQQAGAPAELHEAAPVPEVVLLALKVTTPPPPAPALGVRLRSRAVDSASSSSGQVEVRWMLSGDVACMLDPHPRTIREVRYQIKHALGIWPRLQTLFSTQSGGGEASEDLPNDAEAPEVVYLLRQVGSDFEHLQPKGGLRQQRRYLHSLLDDPVQPLART